MRLAVNPYKTRREIGYVDPAVYDAVAALHIALAHKLPVTAIDPIRPLGEADAVGVIVDSAIGRAPVGEIEFDLLESGKTQGIESPVVFHAMAQVYGWREYCWVDFGLEDSERAFQAGDCVQDYVDGLAKAFDLDEVDTYTRRGSDEKGFIAPAEDAPSPAM